MSKEFELARLHMIAAARNGQIDEVRGYAWAHRIYPFNPYELEEAFEANFKIGRAAMEDVLKPIDDAWMKKQKLVTFYDLEGIGGASAGGLSRMEIYHVCRLAFLDNRFDQSVWSALTVAGSGPIETQGMTEPFEMDHDITY